MILDLACWIVDILNTQDHFDRVLAIFRPAFLHHLNLEIFAGFCLNRSDSDCFGCFDYSGSGYFDYSGFDCFDFGCFVFDQKSWNYSVDFGLNRD